MEKGKLTAKEISSIEKESINILDKFSSALEKATKEKKNDNFSSFYLDRENFERKEGEGRESGEKFKKMILENAPSKNEDFILVERGEWK